MPRRVTQHETGDDGSLAVQAIWNQAGAAVEEIRRDYGEDLLVQPSLNGWMDACRIWVQVKSSRNFAARMARPNGTIRISFGNDLLLRWSRTADQVVLVAWDPSAGLGWYTLPAESFDIYELTLNPNGKSTVVLPAVAEFDLKAAHLIIASARVEHAQQTLATIESKLLYASKYGPQSDVDKVSRPRKALIFNYMLEAGVLESIDEDVNAIRVSRSVLAAIGEAAIATSSTTDIMAPIMEAIADVISPVVIHEELLLAVVRTVYELAGLDLDH